MQCLVKEEKKKKVKLFLRHSKLQQIFVFVFKSDDAIFDCSCYTKGLTLWLFVPHIWVIVLYNIYEDQTVKRLIIDLLSTQFVQNVSASIN